MTYTNLVKTFIVCSFFFTVSSCDFFYCDLKVENKSDSDIYFDITLDDKDKVIFIVKNFYKKNSDSDSVLIISDNYVQKDSIGELCLHNSNWNSYTRNTEFIYFYVIPDSICQKISDKVITNLDTIQHFQKKISVEDIKNNNWTITYSGN